MKVKDLKALLADIPEELTDEQADEMDVMVFKGSDETCIKLDEPDSDCSGYSEFDGSFDKDGKEVDCDEKRIYWKFILFPLGVVTSETPCDESQVVEATLE